MYRLHIKEEPASGLRVTPPLANASGDVWQGDMMHEGIGDNGGFATGGGEGDGRDVQCKDDAGRELFDILREAILFHV